MFKYVLPTSLVVVLFFGYCYPQHLDFWNISGTLYEGPPEIISIYNDDYLFCIKTGTLETYSLTVSAGPVLMNSCPLWEQANCFELIDQFGFMGTPEGLWIWDLSNPILPEDFSVTYRPGSVNSIALTDSFAYVLNDSLLFIINICNPYHAGIIDSIRVANRCRDIKVAGSYAFIACDSTGLITIDISNPLNPVVSDTFETEWPAIKIIINENYACLLEFYEVAPLRESRLLICDVSNPSQPVQMGSVDFIGVFNSITARQNIIYVGGSIPSLFVVDITNPANPAVIDTLSELSCVNDMDIGDTLGYTADLGGVHMLNLSDAASPQIIASAPAFTPVTDVFVRGEYAYVAATSALYIVYIADPRVPIYKGGCTLDIFQGRELFVSGDSAYLASFISGTCVINIADPGNPYQAGYLPSYGSGVSRGICVSGQYAYESGPNLGLRIIDLTGDSGVTEFDTPGPGWNVEVIGNYAYVADAGYLTIINVANPTSPTMASTTTLSGAAWDLCVDGDNVYIAALNGGLQIYNIANPYGPTFTGIYSNGEEIKGVKIFNHYAIAVTSDSELVAINIINPANPVFVSRYTHLYLGQDLFVSDDIIYSADKRSLRMFRMMPGEIQGQDLELPNDFRLLGNYPNPFNSSTTIKYTLYKPEQIKIDIYDMLGRQVQTINSQIRPAGNHEIIWNVNDLASGLYFYRIQAGNNTQTRKCLLIK